MRFYLCAKPDKGFGAPAKDPLIIRLHQSSDQLFMHVWLATISNSRPLSDMMIFTRYSMLLGASATIGQLEASMGKGHQPVTKV